MFFYFVALLFWGALGLLQSGGDAAFTRRQYPTSSDNLIVSPSLGASTTVAAQTSSILSSRSLDATTLLSLTSSAFSNTSSISVTSSSSTTSSATSALSSASSTFTSSDALTATAAESKTDESILSSSGSPGALQSTTSTAEQQHSSTYSSGLSSSSSSVAKPSVTSAPSASFQRPYNSSFPITSGPTSSGNASIRAPYIRFDCTPDPIDAWRDARSCSCKSRLYTYYATQSTGETISEVCHTSGEESYGLRYSAGCSLTTSPLLKTPWVAPDDCCGYCKIEVPTVRIVYWQPQTAAPNVSYTTGNFSVPRVQKGPVTVVEDGYTFTSPSVYIVYSSIRASASCVAMSQTYHTVGGIHVVTRAYPPDHLSSVRCVNSIGIGQGHNSVVWEPINYSDLYDPIPLTKSLSRIDRCFTNRKDNDIWGDWMRKPFISLPQDVSELDPTWTTCSGVAIGAMDPPRALVPAAGFEDPPPSVPADPPSSGPITQSAPSLPTATPGKTVPDPVPLPTPKPVKGTDPNLQPLPQPKPKDDPPTDPHDPSIDPQPEPPSPSPIVKSPSKSPAVAAPQPQEPSPNPPVVKPTGDNGEGSGDGLDVQPPTRGDRPGPEQPSDDRAKQPPANPDPLKSISAVLFPNPSPIVSSGKPGSDGVTGDQVPKGQQQQPTPSDQGGGSSPGGKDDSTPGQIQSDSQGTGSKPGSDHPTTVDAQDQSTAPKDQSNANGDSTVHDGGHSGFESKGQPQPEGSGNIDKSETSSGTGSASPNGSGNSEVVSKGDTSSPAKSPEVQFDSGPRTFAFVSNAPPPVVGSHTIARAPDGAAVVGTATIYPGEAQIVQGTPVSIAPDAIVVGSSTFAVTPPEKAETPAEAPVISQVPGGGLVVGSKTIMPGNQDSINGHEVSVGPSNVFVDGKSIAFPAMTPPPSIPLNIGGVQVSRGSGNRVVIGDSTYKPGAQLTVSGHTVSVGSGEVKIDGTAHSIPGTPAGSPLLVDGQSVFKASDSRVIVGTATLTPGSVTTVGGHAISIATNAVVIDQSTYALPAQPGVAKTPDTPGTPSAAPLTVGEHTISKAANGALIIGASTISPGNQVTIAGHTISAAPNRVIVDDTTYTLPAAAGAVQSPVAAASPITLANGIVVTPGASAITVASEKVISVFPDGKSFVIGGSTITVPTATPTAGESVFTVAGEVFTAAPTGFVIAGMTVSPGGAAVTVSGTVVSLGTVGLRVGSATFPLPTGTSTSTSTDELGDVIMSAFDAGPTTGGAGSADAPASTGVSGVEAFTSGAVRKAGGLKRTVFGLGVGVVVSVIGSFM